jgi:hypothetical protein
MGHMITPKGIAIPKVKALKATLEGATHAGNAPTWRALSHVIT